MCFKPPAHLVGKEREGKGGGRKRGKKNWGKKKKKDTLPTEPEPGAVSFSNCVTAVTCPKTLMVPRNANNTGLS